jgi:Rad3-related DNA helicase
MILALKAVGTEKAYSPVLNKCLSLQALLSCAKDCFTQRASKMELVLVVFSAVSAISTAILVFLILQIQKSLNTNAKKRTESDADIYKQLERLLQRHQAIEQKLVELIDAQSKSVDKVYELLRGSGDLQIGRLQLIIETLEIIKKSIASLYELLRGDGELQVGKLQTVADKLEALKNSLEESIRF